MALTIEQLKKDFEARLEELKPLVEEYEKLQAALDSLKSQRKPRSKN